MGRKLKRSVRLETTTLYSHAGRGAGTVSEYDLKQDTQKPDVSHPQLPDGTTHSVQDVSESQYADPQHKASCGNANETQQLMCSRGRTGMNMKTRFC
jgi:hypothetical protein